MIQCLQEICLNILQDYLDLSQLHLKSFLPYGDGFLLVASQGGAPKHPVWYHNLVAFPDVRITFGGQTSSMNARRVPDEEKAKLWPVCCEYYPPYQDYQARTDRNIPVFLCE